MDSRKQNKITLPFFGRRRASKTIFVETSFIFFSIPSRLKFSIKSRCSLRLRCSGSVAFKFWHNWRASLCLAWPIWAKQNSLLSILTSTAFLSEQTSYLSAGLTRIRSVSLTLLYILFSIALESKLVIFHSCAIICFTVLIAREKILLRKNIYLSLANVCHRVM